MLCSNQITCICEDCKNEWPETYPMPMLLTVFLSRLEVVACPKCGSKKVLMKTGGK